jgi:adenosine deaminase
MRNFKDALQSNSLEDIAKCPKSDLHSHAGRGGNVKYISTWVGKNIAPPPLKFNSLSNMQKWYSDNIRCLTNSREGQIKRWEACFQQAYEDNITVLALSFSASEIQFVGGIEKFIKLLTEFNATISPKTVFLPELTYDRACDVSNATNEIESILCHKFFKSIDICCNEFAQPIKNFKPLYRKAKEYRIRLKAHVGEFGTADDVMEAVEELELDEVHHGIAAAKSDFVMNWLARHKIQLNVCPTSNVMLNVVDEYKNHPIKLLYYAGVPVTINTDDLLIFNQSISQEYLNLYSSEVLDSDALDRIRLTGLNQVNYHYV